MGHINPEDLSQISISRIKPVDQPLYVRWDMVEPLLKESSSLLSEATNLIKSQTTIRYHYYLSGILHGSLLYIMLKELLRILTSP